MKAIGQIYSIRSCFFTSPVHLLLQMLLFNSKKRPTKHSTLNKIRSHYHHNKRSKLIQQLLSSNQHFRYSLYSAKKGFTASPASVAALNQFTANNTLHQQQDQPSYRLLLSNISTWRNPPQQIPEAL
ncbi:hypothetical protein Nepgr_017409 [Nepenthes gracilis]|uniref:Uncharacterized protein n=1 Tax=Nepenthes gracilis TaxID=150966 RepID=A0AAD3XSG2_NEPGR|nr:hypothetical protein Nepgr_017409 [Nepenthes gracilis]